MSHGAGPSAAAAAADDDAAQLELLLRQTLDPATVHAAERRLRKALKPAAAALPLARRAAESDAPEVRQLAAVLLRRRVVGHYEQLAAADRDALKALVLHRLVAEPHAPPRRALAAVASALGAELLPADGGWPELLRFLSDAAQAPTAEHREVAMLVLAELFESPATVAVFRPHLPATVGVLRAGLADPLAPQVRTASLRAVGALATSLLDAEGDAGPGALKLLLPAALDVAADCVRAAAAGGGAARAAGVNDDELRRTLAAAFEMVGEVVESGPSALVRANLAAIAGASLELAHATSAEVDVRAHGFHALTSLCEAKSKLLQRDDALVQRLVQLGAAAVGELDEDEDEDVDADVPAAAAGGEEEDERESVRSLGCALLDTLGCALPAKAYLHHVDAVLHALAARPDEASWRSACTVLAMVVEGCAERLAERKGGAARLDGYVRLLCAACAHASPRVRADAALGLGEMARHVPARALVPPHAPAIIAHLAAVIDASGCHAGAAGAPPAGGAALHAKALDKVCYALDALCEAAAGADELIDVIAPHAPELLARLVALCAAPRASAAARGAAVSALSALVACGQRLCSAEQLEGLIRAMAQLMADAPTAAPGAGALRARATECVGLCALSLGAERFRPLLADACAAAAAGLSAGGGEVSEYAFGFAAHMAALYKAQLDPAFVHAVLPHMLAACRADDVIERPHQREGGEGGAGAAGGGGADDDDDDDDDEGVHFGLHTGMIDEKASAVNAIGRLCKHCAPQLGAPAALECVRALCGDVAGDAAGDDDEDDGAPIDHFVDGLRAAALANAPYACAAALHAARASGDAAAVAAAERAVRGVCVPKLVRALSDEDADTVAGAANALLRLGRLAGGSVFADLDGAGGSAALHAVARALQKLLTGCAPCQPALPGAGGAGPPQQPTPRAPDDGGSDGDSEDDGRQGRDEAVWEAVAALVAGLARTLGDAWAPAVDALLPALLAHAAAGLPLSEQATAIGVIAEAVERLGDATASRLAPQLLPHALRLAGTPLAPRGRATAAAGGGGGACAAAVSGYDKEEGGDEDDDDDDETAQLVQNAVYCAGVLAAPGGATVVSHMQALLTVLRPMLERTAGGAPDRLVDNALGAAARTLRGSFAQLPLQQIVPVMLAALPIKEDFRENGVTLRTLVTLFSDARTSGTLAEHLPRFVQLVAVIVDAHDLDARTRAASAQVVRDDDEAEDADEQESHLTPELRAELVAFLAANGFTTGAS